MTAIRPTAPIYAQIEADLRHEMDTGRLLPGQRLPPEHVLAERYTVARMTVRQALARLTAAGLLIRKQGVGTFVAPRKTERVAGRLLGFREDALAHGQRPTTRVLGQAIEALGEESGRLLELDPGLEVLRVRRLRYTDGDPSGYNTVVVVPPFVEVLAGLDWVGSFYEGVASRLGLEVTDAQQTVEAIEATPTIAQHLGVAAGAPLLGVTRRTYLADGRRVGLTRSLYRGDRYFLSLHVRREGPM